MENFHCALSFVDVKHLNETVSLRFVGVTVVDDFDFFDGSDAFKKVFNVILGGVIGKISYVEPWSLDWDFLWWARSAASFTRA